MSKQMMRAAQVATWGSTPQFITTTRPYPLPNHTEVRVKAAGIHQVVRSRVSGQHYTAGTLPHTPGVDGVGLALPDLTPVYFSAFATGSMAEIINVPSHAIIPLSVDKLGASGISLAAVAAWVNPAMSSWMALKKRVVLSEEQKRDGFSVLVIGATSASGQLAIKLARELGATRVVGAARSEEGLANLELDEIVVLREDLPKTDFSVEAIGSVDVVLDYVFRDVADRFFESVEVMRGKELQYVQIGALGGKLEVKVNGAMLRSKNITIRGSGPGAWSMEDMGTELRGLVDVVVGGEFLKGMYVKEIDIERIEEAWNDKGKDRVALTF